MEKEEDEIAVRRATLRDVEKIYALIRLNSDQLIPRSVGSIVESVDRFFIAECAGEMAGCASYQVHPEIGAPEAAAVEVVSVAVKSVFRRRGIGRRLVEAVIEAARAFGPREVVVLTFTPEFFSTLGFTEIPKTKVMHKLYTGCINCTKHADPFTCPEKAMVKKLGDGERGDGERT